MKPKRYYFRNTALFGTPLRFGTPVFVGFVVMVSGLSANAGDILRGSTAVKAKAANGAGSGTALTRAATAAARANAKDVLRRSGQTLKAMRAMQNAARAAAANGPNHLAPNLPDVPDGLRTGGLKPSDTLNWSGANQPVETTSGENVNVTIKQNTQQALLHWQTFNVGKKTTLTFDQSAGGENVGQWIAFNQVNDPAGNPTQILGNIKADGQIYLINRNGVIFGGSSQVNARGLTVSSLPINSNLISQGLLNNRDSQFLFSGLSVPGGSDGTPDFNPAAAPNDGYGDVTVQEGAVLTAPVDSSGGGGRITLIGANVSNAGQISAAAGQAILAAGLQVGLTAHDSNDPSLRGLDVWVGDVGDYAGNVTNSGLIEIHEGSATMTGKSVNQLGYIESSTSVGLNGRIDLLANYGAVSNPNYDTNNPALGGTGPQFLFQKTGSVTLAAGSTTRILPDYTSDRTVPGTELPERSQINIEGLSIHFEENSQLFAPNAAVSVRAGTRTYVDLDGNRTIFDAGGNVESGIANHFTGSNQKFLFSVGQIYVDRSATISVAGSVDVFVSLDQSVLTVDLRGAELADSPLQRASPLRGESLTVDIRNTGSYNGRFWEGTPYGDVTALAGLIERNAAQLTAVGGDINFRAGDSIILREGSVLDVSGGYYTHEAGLVKTSSLLTNGRRVAMKDAVPDLFYDGVFSGESVINDEKWGVSKTFSLPFFSGTYQKSYAEGAAGGNLTLSAPGMAIDGDMRGITVLGDRQRSSAPAPSQLSLSFTAEHGVAVPGGSLVKYIDYSPTPPEITFANQVSSEKVAEFSLSDGVSAGLSESRLKSVVLSTALLDEDGFGSISVSNPDGSINVPESVVLTSKTGGEISLAAANITVGGSIISRSGSISLGTYNISPSYAAESEIINSANSAPIPMPELDRGLLVLSGTARLDARGLATSDLLGYLDPFTLTDSAAGGEVTLRSYNTNLSSGSVIDVSGGVHVTSRGKKTYGNGGSITIVSGTDDGFPGLIGGELTLESSLRGYSGSKGGSLSIQASAIQVGGGLSGSDLVLAPDFFSTGGFSKYSLSAIGERSDATPLLGQFESYTPAIVIGDGVVINPVTESLIARVDGTSRDGVRLKRTLLEKGLRTPVSLEFKAMGADDSFSTESLEVRGDLVMNAGSRIEVGPGGSVSLKGQTATILGSVIAPGGSITVSGSSAFPFTSTQRLSITQALPTVHLGETAYLSAAGSFLKKPDIYGRRTGTVFGGGSINLSGNIIAENGAVLDVSGTSSVLDLSPTAIVKNRGIFRRTQGGVMKQPIATRGIATRVDSAGGSISLAGSEMLLSDATLIGNAGGGTAVGGSLSVSSGRYYEPNAPRTGADINLIVSQNDSALRSPDTEIGVGIKLVDAKGKPYGNIGEFAVSRFESGGFADFSLAGNYSEGSSPPVGGNVNFKGDVALNVPGTLRLAAGGVVTTEGNTIINAGYAAIGQGFRAPVNPGDEYTPFKQLPANPGSDYRFSPTYGTGSIALNAEFIDIGTLSLQSIGAASFNAANGDIRGNGVLHIAGDLTLSAATIYPTTGSTFSIFAYDHGKEEGSITFNSSGAGKIPLSAGGTLEAYASTIHQHGVLRAPGGSIILGWDGTDLDTGDVDIDSPYDRIAGTTIGAPVSKLITLGDGSITSVSTYSDDQPNLVIPYGLSPDGRSWIDPSGENVSLNGLPGKSVAISSDDLQMASGAVVDVRGGGDYLASRWVSGSGGSVNLLDTATAAWRSGTEYSAGDLVLYNGTTWSARVGNTGRTPTVSPYWTKVAESYAIIPSASLPYAPYGAFNSGSNAGLLAGDPGYVNTGLKVGDMVTLDAGSGLPAGSYTLLPRKYALLPGAYLVTPLSGAVTGAYEVIDGSRQVSGFVTNRFSSPGRQQATRTRFEVASAAVIGERAEYKLFHANEFLSGLANDAGAETIQRLPGDAGNVRFHGGSDLSLAGSLLTSATGRGASVDVSSFADILVSGASVSTEHPGSVSLSGKILGSWNAESLLIGGLRNTNADGTISVDVRTSHLEINNPDAPLVGSDIVLVSRKSLEVSDGSSIITSGAGISVDTLNLTGDGSLIRISQDFDAEIDRSEITNSGIANVRIGSNVSLQGQSVILDSTSGMSLAPSVNFNARRIVVGSGGISMLLDDSVVGPVKGTSRLILDGTTLDSIFRSEDVTLRSYGSIDLYGAGNLGSSSLARLSLATSALRGYEVGGGTVSITAGLLNLDNELGSAAIASAGLSSGRINFTGETVRMGENAMTASGYDVVSVNASNQWIVGDTGSFSAIGDLQANTPLLTGEAGSIHSISSTGRIVISGGHAAPSAIEEFGASIALQGSSVEANTNIILPSGNLSVIANAGDIVIGGNLSVSGTSKQFHDVTRYTNAGEINLTSRTGSVLINQGGAVSVSGAAGGGNAGLFNVSSAAGTFRNLGSLTGLASSGYTAGSFTGDVGSFDSSGSGSLGSLNSILNDGGFSGSQNFRIRNGDVIIDYQNRSRNFSLSADNGSITVTGKIDASGDTGGAITLASRGDLMIASGATLTVAAEQFNSAGKGGTILLEAGTQKNGVANDSALLSLTSGAVLDLSVAEWVAGDYKTPGSSAFNGKFTGTLHLRAPRNTANTDLGIASIQSSIFGASSILAEGFKVYEPTNGVMNTALRSRIDSDNKAFLGTAGTLSVNEAAIQARLLSGASAQDALASLLVIAPGVEIINRNGNLTLGLANTSTAGSTSAEARYTADWDLSSFRYGSRGAPGILSLRASGDLVFNNTLSDGFTPLVLNPFLSLADAGDSLMWLGALASINDKLPTNTQSWSYRLTAGADTNSSDFRAVLGADVLGDKGSILVGEFYPAVPNTRTSGSTAAVGSNGLTANSIRISTTSADRGNRFEIIRTGTGDISLNAGLDIQLRNQFASIYTAGVALPEPTKILATNDFVLPVVPIYDVLHPSQSASGGLDLGAVQQIYQPSWSMAGGNISISATRNIGRYTMVDGVLTVDSSRQMPTNWLYRRGFVDPSTGLFSNDGGFGDNRDYAVLPDSVYDPATSTAWWVDFSNFFQGIGTLGGGNINLLAGNDIVNVDAAAPTNARMAGRMENPDFGSIAGAPEYLNLAPNSANLVELGGGDITISSGRNISGGVYYVERGEGALHAGGSIITNAARTPSRGILTKEESYGTLTWLPTTLFVGKSNFDVVARGSVLLGPVANPFLLPQGLNNSYWYKTYFSTYSQDAGATVAAYGGDITHRYAIALPSGGSSRSIFSAWFTNQNLFTGAGSSLKSSYSQPWLRLMETGLTTFEEVFKLNAPNLSSTSFVGGINIVGDLTLAPSPSGNLELVASTGISGLNPTGISSINGGTATIWTSAKVNVSDASLSSIPGILTPLAYQSLVGRDRRAAVFSGIDVLKSVSLALSETGSYAGAAGIPLVQQALHGSGLLHAGDLNPVRLTALDGDITGLALFSPKAAEITAQRDITDVSFYIQNVNKGDISIVSAGRDLIPYSESSELRTIAGNLEAGNIIDDSQKSTSLGTTTNALAGDLQISGPGVLEVLTGNSIDLGTGANFTDGTGTGITSIGNSRNPNLPFGGADLIVLSGVTSRQEDGPALGLADSSLDFGAFIREFLQNPSDFYSDYLEKIGKSGEFESLTSEQQAIVSLEEFYHLLRDSGRDAGKGGDYADGFEAISVLFGTEKPIGDVNLRAREIRTVNGGSISMAAPGGDIVMASEVYGNPLTPPGIVTEYGGAITTFTNGDVEIGQSRIFTLRGGDIIMWSSEGNIAAGSAPRTVVTAPPTRVAIDLTSASVQTDLGGLATGGGIGVLAAVKDVKPGNVDLIAPNGFVDAGDAGIRVTGNLNIAAQVVLNSSNISAGGTTTGSAVSAPAAPSVSTVTSASNAAAAATTTATAPTNQTAEQKIEPEEVQPSVITVEVIGYGGGSGPADEEDDETNQNQ